MSIGTCEIDDDCGPGYECLGGVCVRIPDTPPPTQLPGLGQFLRRRYTSNLAVVEQMSVNDLLHEVIFPASRQFLAQSETGKISLKHKKPVPFAYATSGLSAGASNNLPFDNVEDFQGGTGEEILILAPHTNHSEIHTLRNAVYPTSQNSVGLSSTGGLFTISGFSGCNGSDVPATASITVNSATANTDCTITLNGTVFAFTTNASGETTDSIASYIAGVIASHPALWRKFKVSWTEGSSVVNLTARYGTLRFWETIISSKSIPATDPTTAPTLAASGSGSGLAAGSYVVAYCTYSDTGDSLLSPYKTITITAGQQIDISTVSVPSGGNGIKWFCSPEADSTKIRYVSSNNGTGFAITSANLPRLSAPLPPDLNRSGCEIMQVSAVFTDRTLTRVSPGAARSNVLKAAFSWFLGTRSKTVNRIDLKYRDASQDYRLIELRLRDDAHIEKTKKIQKEEVNGQAIDNTDQAYRIASSLLAEKLDADFFYKWKSTRESLLLQEGDVVAITDEGSGVVNLPTRIEEIEFEIPTGSLPMASFTGRKYASTLYDDSIVERTIPVVSEN